MASGSNILIGTSSWSDHRRFYPPGTSQSEQLAFYARTFPIVEVNTTYYHIPLLKTVRNWVERTPDGFVFDVKPPRELTATPETPRGVPPEPDADLARDFAKSIRPLADAGKLGTITFQFPPSYRNTDEHREYLRLLRELFPDYPIAVEFRRRDWLDENHAPETLELLEQAGLGFTMVDEPQIGSGTVPPVYGVTNPNLAVIRFHGRNSARWYDFSEHGRRFDWEYTAEELAPWIPRIRRAAETAERVHVFFNTNVEDQGPRNAALLMSLLGMPGAPERKVRLFDFERTQQ